MEQFRQVHCLTPGSKQLEILREYLLLTLCFSMLENEICYFVKYVYYRVSFMSLAQQAGDVGIC